MRKRAKLKTLKRKLDLKFSTMIRLRDEGKPCISCGLPRTLQAGHFIKRAVISTRWHPYNVNGECAGCNGFDGSHLIGYFMNLDKRRGPGTAEALFKLAKVRWKMLPDQLERLILACDTPENYESEWMAVQREFYAGTL